MKHSKKFFVIGLLVSIHPSVEAKENWGNVRKAENQEFYSIISEEASVSETLDKRVFRNTAKMIDRKNSNVEMAHPAVSITPARSKPMLVANGYRTADNDPTLKDLAKEFRLARVAMYSKPYYKIPVAVKPDNYEKAFSYTLAPRPALTEAEEIKNSVDRAFADTQLHRTSMGVTGPTFQSSSSGGNGTPTFQSPHSDDASGALQVTSGDIRSGSAQEVGSEFFNTPLHPTKRRGFFDVLKEVFSGK